MSRPAQVEVRVLRVFCGPGGEGGNPLGVVLDGPLVAADDRQALAAHLGYSETVFVDDAPSGRIAIFTPEVELPFAGHPTVGTAWLLTREGHAIDALRTPAGKVPVRVEGRADAHVEGRVDGHVEGRAESRVEGDWAFARGRPEWCPAFELLELDSPAAVDAHPVADRLLYAWAWIDEDAGRIRTRCFVPEAGIAEDEATGSAALRLCAALDRPIEIHQGRGSRITARPTPDGMVEIGGTVVEA